MDIPAVLCIIIKNIIYGSSVYFTGRLTETANVFDILALRFLITFTVLFVLKKLKLLKINVEIRDLFKNRSRITGDLLLCALFEPILYMIFETMGISMTTGVTAGVILALLPVVSCVLEVIVLKEKGSFLKYFFIVLGVFGVLYITVKTDTATGENTAAGILFMFLAVFSGSAFMVFVRKTTRYYKPVEIAYITAALGAFVFNFINIVRHILSGDLYNYFKPLCSYDNIVGFVFLAIISSVLAAAMGNYALKKMQVSTATAFSGLSTLVTIALGVFINNESLYYYHYIGLSLIMLRIAGISFLEAKSGVKSA